MDGLLLRLALALSALLAAGMVPCAHAVTFEVIPSAGGVYEVTPSAVVGDTIEATSVVGGTDYGFLGAQAWSSTVATDGIEFSRLLSAPVSDAALSGSSDFAVTQTLRYGTAAFAGDAAFFCFTGPVQAAVCGAGALAGYLTAKSYFYGPPPAGQSCPGGASQCWTVEQTYVPGTCSVVGYSAVSESLAVCESFVESNAGAILHASYVSLPCHTSNCHSSGTSFVGPAGPDNHYGLHVDAVDDTGVTHDQIVGTWVPQGSPSVQLVLADQPGMSADLMFAMQASPSDMIPAAEQVHDGGGAEPIRSTDPASLSASPSSLTGTDTSTITNPDGTVSTNTTTTSVNAVPGTGTTLGTAALAITKGTTQTQTAPDGSTTTTTTTSTSSQPQQADAAKQCGFDSGDACFVQPTDSFTAPTIGDAKTFQQSTSDFYASVAASPIAQAVGSIVIPSGTCGIYTWTMFSRSYTMDSQCVIAEQIRAPLGLIMVAVWTALAAIVFLKA